MSSLNTHFKDMTLALYLVKLFAPDMRPTALHRMYAKDAIAPEREHLGSHHVLIVSPFEKVVATESGYHDKTVTLDGTVCTALERLVKRHANRMQKTEEPQLNVDHVIPWNFRARDCLEALRATCEHLGFDNDITTNYQAHCGGIQGPYAGHQNDT